MRKCLLLIIFCSITFQSICQNQVRISGGIFSTNTSVSEYNRGLNYFYYDSVLLDTRVTRPTLNVDIDIDLGKRFYFSSGISYSTKGMSSINYTKVEYWYSARQEYIGLNINLKYHHKFRNEKFGIYAAAGAKADYAVGGPTSAEIALLDGKEYFHAFGTFNQVDFSFRTLIGLSYKFGPGDIVFDVNFQNGIGDVIADRYIVGRTFSIGTSLGYSIYL